MSGKRILLVDPKTRTSYPPLGLMKIATYHKLKGDEVHFVVGKTKKNAEKDEREKWDKICITSVFTYDYNKLIDTIKYYLRFHSNINKVEVGGIAATLLADKIEKDTNIVPHKGLQNTIDPFLQKVAHENPRFSYLLECGPTIDNLVPSYDIFPEDNPYKKITDNNYLFFATKGCPNKCGFCAVKVLEPEYVPYVPIKPRIDYIAKEWGERQGLLLLDNNIAASDCYFRIMDEIKDCGFGKGEKLCRIVNGRKTYRNRYVDFNQGVDLRLMDKAKMKKMAEIAIKPLRLAFDDFSLAELYEEKMRLAIDCGIESLSNYMLYNFKDRPEDLYRRFMVNMRILEDYPHAKIYSFPMRYSPVDRIDRKYIGEKWTKRYVRAIQIVLNATHGIVSHKRDFFLRAFGKTEDCFKRVLVCPYHYLINRNIVEYSNMLLQQWEYDYEELSPLQKKEFLEMVKDGPIQGEMPTSSSGKIMRLLEHYEEEKAVILGENFWKGKNWSNF